jgi:hypothetical protein
MEAFLQSMKSYHVETTVLPHPPTNKVALMVEPRAHHPYLELVVRNALACLDSSWDFQIWTYEKEIAYVRSLFPDLGPRLQIRGLPLDSITTTLYNILFLAPQFWESIGNTYEHILVFQTDCVFFRKLDNQWLDYDYAGANYYHPIDVSPKIGGIQGGLSYRKKSTMLECTRKCTSDSLNEYRRSFGSPPIHFYKEDVFFTHACEVLQKKVPACPVRPIFSIEADFYDQPFGHHGWNKPYLHPDQIRQLLSLSIFANTKIGK